MNTLLENFKNKLQGGFFWFWIKQWRTTILLLILIMLIWAYSAYRIPKESFPEINLGMVTITTLYPWGNPEDIDTLITKKIENQISSIEGIDRIDSTSTNNLSTLIATLENGVDVNTTANKIQDAIQTLALPTDAKDPVISQIDMKTIGRTMFSLALYAKDARYSKEYLTEKAFQLKKALENVGDIDTINISNGTRTTVGVRGSQQPETYKITILIDQNKLNQLQLSLTQISTLLQGFNTSQPLGKHRLGKKEYSFRIDGEKQNLEEIAMTPISLPSGKTIPLKSIATIKKEYDQNTNITIGNIEWNQKDIWNFAILLSFNRKSSTSVLSASKSAKQTLEEELKKPDYEGLGHFYTQDLWKKISELYNDLVVNMISTLLIVFLIVFCFVGSMESFLATVSIPLSFFVTFFVLNSFGYTMNTLTNFSLIICLGIAVDTATVIIQGASENLKKGYQALHAVLLSVKTYKNSLISGTATTVVVFIPLMTLPGVMGKSLALIPITLFTTLVASLFISLTITPVIYYLTTKTPNTFKKEEKSEAYLSEGNRALLANDRRGKRELTEEKKLPLRERILNTIVSWYDKKISWTLDNTLKSVAWVIIPLLLFTFTISLIAPKIGFLMMPKYDSENMSINLTAEPGFTPEKMEEKAKGLHEVLSAIPELENYTLSINGNTISVAIVLTAPKARKRTSFDIENELADKLQFLQQRGFETTIATVNNMQGSSSEVGIQIKAEDNVSQTTIAQVARDFENYLKSLPGTKNISNSSKESPWQFVFTLDEDRLALLGLTKKSVGPLLYLALNGISAGTVKIDKEHHDISIKYNAFDDSVSPDTLMGTLIPTSKGQIPLANIASYSFKPAVTSISRKDGEITITLGANLKQGVKAENINNQLYAYADSYPFPEGISYAKWGEQTENADLIISLLSSIVFAFIMIFWILVLQFNSYTQPLIISYSLLMGFIGASFWMLLTWNPYSMMFLIGFIALMGIIVNNAIILIDSANENITHGYSRSDAIKESAKSRIKPILSTTLTTVIGMITLLTNGMFVPLAYTIMFGLSFGTVVTLFAIPVLYQGENKIRLLIKRILFKPALTFIVPIITIWIIYLLCTMFWYSIFSTRYWTSAMMALFWSSIIFLIVFEFSRNSVWRPWRRQGLLNLKMITTKNISFSKKQILKRMLIKFWLLLVPLCIGGIITLIIKLLDASETTTLLATKVSIGIWYLFYIMGNLYCFWTSEEDQFLHDKISGIVIIDADRPEKN